jgi:hypothetical protein
LRTGRLAAERHAPRRLLRRYGVTIGPITVDQVVAPFGPTAPALK